MAFETTLTVPTPHIRELMSRLGKAGFLVLDTGERISNEDGVGAEATLKLVHISVADLDETCELGVAR
jgi:hypothetical protein